MMREARPATSPSDAWTLAERRVSPRLAYAYGLSLVRSRIVAGQPRMAALFTAALASAPRSSIAWLAFLAELRDRLSLDVLPFDLAKKIYRPFFSRRLGMAERANLLRSHYELMTAAFGAGFVRTVLSGGAVQLAELTGLSGERYVIDALRTFQFKDEGEMILSIYGRSTPDKRLGNLVVTVGEIRPGAGLKLWIGGMQGVCGARGLIEAATQDLDGFRPKAALLEAAWALVGALRGAGVPVNAIAAIANEANMLGGHHVADYDAYWSDLGGRPTAHGYYLLPTAAPKLGEGLSPGQAIGPKRMRKWRYRLEARRQLHVSLGRLSWGARG